MLALTSSVMALTSSSPARASSRDGVRCRGKKVTRNVSDGTGRRPTVDKASVLTLGLTLELGYRGKKVIRNINIGRASLSIFQQALRALDF